jgi:hypothetical protein
MSPHDAATRLAARTFPSIAAPFTELREGQGDVSAMMNLAAHDITWMLITIPALYPPMIWDETTHKLVTDPAMDLLGVAWNNAVQGRATGLTITEIGPVVEYVRQVRTQNPNIVILHPFRYYSAVDNGQFLDTNDAFWLLSGGNKVPTSTGASDYRVDFTQSGFRSLAYQRAQAIWNLGIYDGFFFDWWADSSDVASRVEILSTLRTMIGSRGILVANTNRNQAPNAAPYLNGLYMEPSGDPSTGTDNGSTTVWSTIATNLAWAQSNLQAPHCDVVEVWPCNGGSWTLSQRTANPSHMRAATTIALVYGPSFVNFGDPDTINHDHVHNWYSFWDKTQGGKSLGTVPVSTKYRSGGAATLSGDSGGAFARDYSGGTVVYNPSGNGTVTVTFGSTQTRASTGATGTSFTVAALDGEIFFS